MSTFMPPLRTSTTNSVTQSASPVRIASNASIMTNKQATHEESLYYICLTLMTRLTKVPGMMPYIELAHAKSEDQSENQAYSISAPEYIEESLHSGNPNEYVLNHWLNALYTFSTGILPQQTSYDPVTAISNLFRQGAPLCLIFNSLNPENSIEIVSSDDIKICKMSIYKFLLASKQHLNIRDDELFPVTMVFSNDTTHLMRVIKSVEFVLNMDPNFDCLPIKDQVTITDSRSKVVKELIETERKYVQDLETLVRYRQELINKEIVTSENLNMLFPNLTEIADFQRRFLVGLESNGNVPPEYQRIGSIFIHAGIDSFKMYESWSLLQTSAIDFINKESLRLEGASSIIRDPYELQNFFLIKPIQRLLKYPLLLSQLIKESSVSWPYYEELTRAYTITKEVAFYINEAQRKCENLKTLKELQEKVVDWKGYNTNNVGNLLYFNVVTVKDLLTDGHSNEKEVYCYLFEKVIYFFKEVSARNKLLGNRKKSNVSLGNNFSQSSFNLSSTQLVLNGIVYINKITRSSTSDSSSYFGSSPGHYLSLKWKGNKDTGGCVMRFRSEEQLLQWNKSLKRLIIDGSTTSVDSDEIYLSAHSSGSLASFTGRNSNGINLNHGKIRISSDSTNVMINRMRTASTSSFNTMGNVSYPPLPTEKKLRSVSITSSSSNGTTRYNNRKSSSNTSLGADEIISNVSNLTLSKPYSNGPVTPTGKELADKTFIKMSFKTDMSSINLSVSSDLKYKELSDVLIKKVNFALGSQHGTQNLKLKYRDEDGDYVIFSGDDDWELAKEMVQLEPNGILELNVEISQ